MPFPPPDSSRAVTTPGSSGEPGLPPGFVLGVATSAYQVEGAADVDGRGPCIWDAYCAEPGRIVDGTSGAVAADHYHRVEEDLALLDRLGVGGYRFSVSWSRVLPSGRGGPGAVNQRGLDFYDRLVDRLLEAGIAPMATLYHHDLPLALNDDGGWLNPATVDAFADYAEVVGARLADRVAHWVPVNEPNASILFGYATGTHAPGYALYFDALHAVHHVLLGHGRAAAELRSAGATSIGCANNHAPMWPASDDPADVGAGKLFDAVWNGLFMDPMLLGRYPDDLAPLLAEIAAPGDLATIRHPLDFYGVNYYSPMRIAAAPESSPMPFEVLDLTGHPRTDRGWTIVPGALQEWLVMASNRYRAALPPLVITESGAAFHGDPDDAGVVDDADRIAYLDTHLRAVARAVEQGADVRGYYLWSLLDAFEWTEGLSQRYGLVHVDHETQARTPKRSFDWYRALIAAHRA